VKWTDVLPAPWSEDPDVVVVMVPAEDAKIMVGTNKEETVELLCLILPGNVKLGLQVISPEKDTYSEHNETFRQLGVRMAHPAHFGRLSALPDKYLYASDFRPFVFNKAHMSHTFLDVRKAMTEQSTNKAGAN
jgi:hypothetical protein